MKFIDAERIPPTGHPRIDAGHRDLAEQVNDLYELWQQGVPQDRILHQFDLLLRVVGRHFAEEEDIGRQCGFECLSQHQARHAALMADLTEMVERVRAGTGYHDLTIDVFDCIDTLLYEHEIVDDQDFWLLFRDGLPDEGREGDLILWTADMETGLDCIDADHRALVDLLNRLAAALGGDAPDRAVRYLLNRVLEHSKAHFALEEGMMERAGAPGLETHRALHQHLLKDLLAIIDHHAAGAYADLDHLMHNYLKYWLIDHIRNVDAVYLPRVPEEARGREDEEPGEA